MGGGPGRPGAAPARAALKPGKIKSRARASPSSGQGERRSYGSPRRIFRRSSTWPMTPAPTLPKGRMSRDFEIERMSSHLA